MQRGAGIRRCRRERQAVTETRSVEIEAASGYDALASLRDGPGEVQRVRDAHGKMRLDIVLGDKLFETGFSAKDDEWAFDANPIRGTVGVRSSEWHLVFPEVAPADGVLHIDDGEKGLRVTAKPAPAPRAHVGRVVALRSRDRDVKQTLTMSDPDETVRLLMMQEEPMDPYRIVVAIGEEDARFYEFEGKVAYLVDKKFSWDAKKQVVAFTVYRPGGPFVRYEIDTSRSASPGKDLGADGARLMAKARMHA